MKNILLLIEGVLIGCVLTFGLWLTWGFINLDRPVYALLTGVISLGLILGLIGAFLDIKKRP